MGFGAQYTVVTIRNPQNSIGNYFGPYITVFRVSLSWLLPSHGLFPGSGRSSRLIVWGFGVRILPDLSNRDPD